MFVLISLLLAQIAQRVAQPGQHLRQAAGLGLLVVGNDHIRVIDDHAQLERAAAQAMCDSMIASMQVRYDRLCEARREAYAIVDSALRAEYLERNDLACRALSDSLQIIVEQRATIEK